MYKPTVASIADGQQIDDALTARAGFDVLRAGIAAGKRRAATDYRGWQQMESALNDAQGACGRLTGIPYVSPDHRPAA